MTDEKRANRRALLKAIGVLVGGSAVLFFGTATLSEEADGPFAGLIVAVMTAVILGYAASFYVAKVRNPYHQLILVCVVVMQVTPFLFAGIYGAMGYDESCIDLAKNPVDALYFSYTTFTTVGYGDMAPLGYCRIVSSAQGMVGYLLLGALGAALYAVIDDRYKRQS